MLEQVRQHLVNDEARMADAITISQLLPHVPLVLGTATQSHQARLELIPAQPVDLFETHQFSLVLCLSPHPEGVLEFGCKSLSEGDRGIAGTCTDHGDRTKA